jgi:RNA polymerase sigma-70 factor (ECF subfamily)
MQAINMQRSDNAALCPRPALVPADNTCGTSPIVDGAAAEIFESHRSRLFGVAYRMLRTRADADDVVQDAYLRWHETTKEDIESPIGFLITVTTRLCLDRLRRSKREREEWADPELLEAAGREHVPSPEDQCEGAEEVSAAFLTVLERLGGEERAAFLLREVFDYDYLEVAKILGKSESACRQLMHRSRTHLRDSPARFAVTPECHGRVLKKFLVAIATCDRQAIRALLAEKIEYVCSPTSAIACNA